jgi:hypothetical protein
VIARVHTAEWCGAAVAAVSIVSDAWRKAQYAGACASVSQMLRSSRVRVLCWLGTAPKDTRAPFTRD